MSSKTIKRKIQEITKDLSENRPINIKEITIPFSEFLDHNSPSDIYSGKDKIPFSKHHSEYQTIFRNEFTGELRNFF